MVTLTYEHIYLDMLDGVEDIDWRIGDCRIRSFGLKELAEERKKQIMMKNNQEYFVCTDGKIIMFNLGIY